MASKRAHLTFILLIRLAQDSWVKFGAEVAKYQSKLRVRCKNGEDQKGSNSEDQRRPKKIDEWEQEEQWKINEKQGKIKRRAGPQVDCEDFQWA